MRCYEFIEQKVLKKLSEDKKNVLRWWLKFMLCLHERMLSLSPRPTVARALIPSAVIKSFQKRPCDAHFSPLTFNTLRLDKSAENFFLLIFLCASFGHKSRHAAATAFLIAMFREESLGRRWRWKKKCKSQQLRARDGENEMIDPLLRLPG